jgi:hypothetical protein
LRRQIIASTVFRIAAEWVAAACLASCATSTDRATFVTKTSFSLLDADTAPASATIAYDRFEGYVGPKFVDGKVYPVAGFFESTGPFYDRELHQVYAGGDAALIATSQAPAPPASASSPGRPASSAANLVLIFATATTIGLKLGFSDGLMSSLTLGYKRKEATSVPASDGVFPSVLASLDNATSAPAIAHAASAASALSSASPASGAFGVQQYFATGDAANNLARLESIRRSFQEKATDAVGEVQTFRFQEAEQGRLALGAVNCVLRTPDAALAKVWTNAQELDIFPGSTTVDRIRAAPTPDEQRRLYAVRLAALIDPASTDYTRRLRLHHAAVCF